jgi:hypothetical protein
MEAVALRVLQTFYGFINLDSHCQVITNLSHFARLDGENHLAGYYSS